MLYPKASICVMCGVKIKKDRHFKFACSTACQKAFNGGSLRQSFLIKKCLGCGEDFTPKITVQIYCKKECRLISLTNNKLQEGSNLFSIFHRDKFTCIYCGKSSIEDGVKLHVDHIKTFYNGGSSTIDNLITACQCCNNEKHQNDLSEDIYNRVLNILSNRNKNLTKMQLTSIERQISFLHSRDLKRRLNLKK